MNYVLLRTPSASCHIALHGAHVTSYIRNGVERFFVSEQAIMDGTKPIRGGVPICWPWFGQLHPDIQEHKIAHGLVRNQPWRILAQTHSENTSSVTLSPSNLDQSLWPKGLSCIVKITLNESLEIRLTSINDSSEPITFTAALHSYFAVSDVSEIQLRGFGKAHQYIDNNSGLRYDFDDEIYPIHDEVDRVHLLPAPSTTIECDAAVTMTHQGHDSLVVWNPGVDKAMSLGDLANEEYRQFLCIETAMTQGHTLSPNGRHTISQRID